MSDRAMLVAVGPDGRTAWEHDGHVHVVVGDVVWSSGDYPFPLGSRWESSLQHWSHYFRAVRIPAGWRWATITEQIPARERKGER